MMNTRVNWVGRMFSRQDIYCYLRKSVTPDQIREFVDKHGWSAAKADPVLGPLVREMRAEQRAYEDSIIEPDYETHEGR